MLNNFKQLKTFIYQVNKIAEECILCDFGIYPDFFLQALTERIGSYIKLVLRLQANPELGGHSEESCKPERCISSNFPLFKDYFIYRHAMDISSPAPQT